ncbi:MAG: hypothetical protein ACR2IQ_02675 [Minisyncoccia bacterium]
MEHYEVTNKITSEKKEVAQMFEHYDAQHDKTTVEVITVDPYTVIFDKDADGNLTNDDWTIALVPGIAPEVAPELEQ